MLVHFIVRQWGFRGSESGSISQVIDLQLMTTGHHVGPFASGHEVTFEHGIPSILPHLSLQESPSGPADIGVHDHIFPQVEP